LRIGTAASDLGRSAGRRILGRGRRKRELMEPTAGATPAISHATSTLTEALKGFTLIGGDWVLWILIFASVLSVTVMIERLIYFIRNRTPVERFIEAF